MKIFKHIQQITLTNHQHIALEKLLPFLESDERLFILQGYIGHFKFALFYQISTMYYDINQYR